MYQQGDKMLEVRELLVKAFATAWKNSDQSTDRDTYINSSITVIDSMQVQPEMIYAEEGQGLTDGDFQIGRMGWIADYPTLDNFIFPNFYSTADNNYSRYNNPEVDAAIDDARKIADEDERKEAYRKINQMVADDMPVIPIMFYAHQHVASDRVNELYYNAQGIADLGHASLRA